MACEKKPLVPRSPKSSSRNNRLFFLLKAGQVWPTILCKGGFCNIFHHTCSSATWPYHSSIKKTKFPFLWMQTGLGNSLVTKSMLQRLLCTTSQARPKEILQCSPFLNLLQANSTEHYWNTAALERPHVGVPDDSPSSGTTCVHEAAFRRLQASAIWVLPVKA
jgi:hypothetical protein